MTSPSLVLIPPPDYDTQPEPVEQRQRVAPPEPMPDYEDEEVVKKHYVQETATSLMWDQTPAPLSHLSTMKRKHIQNIGVPLFPVPGRNTTPVTPMSDNRAFLRHLANHSNFDTVKSLRTSDDCPICRTVVAQPPGQARDVIIEEELPEEPEPIQFNHHKRKDVLVSLVLAFALRSLFPENNAE